MADKSVDMVNRPPHYVASNGIEAIDVIEGFGLNYRVGNAVKYILRHQKKGKAVEDLKKAVYYLQREVAFLEARREGLRLGREIEQEAAAKRAEAECDVPIGSVWRWKNGDDEWKVIEKLRYGYRAEAVKPGPGYSIGVQKVWDFSGQHWERIS